MRKVIILSIAVAGFALAEDKPNPNHFLNTDVFELEIAADPQISPDGSRVAYVRNSLDIMSDRVRANIWIVDADGGIIGQWFPAPIPTRVPAGRRTAIAWLMYPPPKAGARKSMCAGWKVATRRY